VTTGDFPMRMAFAIKNLRIMSQPGLPAKRLGREHVLIKEDNISKKMFKILLTLHPLFGKFGGTRK
jgi:hypothetical protein